MDWVDLKAKIRAYAQEIGIDKIGFTDSQPLSEHLPRLLARQQGGYKYAINEGDPEKRVSPQYHLPQVRSIISAAVAYPGQDRDNPGQAGPLRGRVSLISRGRDYHRIVGEKLGKLKEYILKRVPEARIELFADTGELLEKAIAVKAGLGWFGRNTLLVTPEFGSWVSLGELVTDLPLPPDQPSTGSCGSCRRCLEACPTKAVDDDKNINPDRCLAGLTLSKALLPLEIRPLMGNTLYGCDICQLVCPYNQRTGVAEQNRCQSSVDEAYPVLRDVLQLTNAEYKKIYGHTSGAWRGRTPLQRNALIAAGNLRDLESVPALITILTSDARPVMRGTAAWALGRIGAAQCREALKKAAATEQDLDVLHEINLALLD